MKLADIVQVFTQVLGISDIKEINKLLKVESAPKFRITGKALGHFGFTGQIKSISEEGVKVFMANKVSLVRLADIETFEKAKPRVERPVRAAKPEPVKKVTPKKGKAPVKAEADDIDEGDDDFDFEMSEDDFGIEDEEKKPVRPFKKSQSKPTGKSGSRFIPSSKK